MNKTVLLIGPVRSGKTTLGRLVADRLGRPSASLDDHYPEYRDTVVAEGGGGRGEPSPELDVAPSDLWEEAGKWGNAWLREGPVSAVVLERFLADHQECVLDLGAGHSVYEGAVLERVSALLEPYVNVFLLLPAPDPEESIAILRKRLTYPMHIALNPVFVKHPANRILAKHVIYTEGRSPGETCKEIVARVQA